MGENSAYVIDNEVTRLLDDLALNSDAEHLDIVTLDETDKDEFGSIMHNGSGDAVDLHDEIFNRMTDLFSGYALQWMDLSLMACITVKLACA
ncbi:uncharacterized protein LOC142321731 isoform X2 [Lycorma delicatula]